LIWGKSFYLRTNYDFKMKRLLATLIIVLMPSIAVAQDFDTGWAAYKKGNYEAAYEAWVALAKSGDPQSQTAIGSLYYLGLGVRHDHAEAHRLFMLAAEKGFPSALLSLGIFYVDPDNEPDFVEAYKWFRLAEKRRMEEAGIRRHQLSEKMTSAQIATAERLVLDWLDAHPGG
jgi:TPR repeat protein